MNALPSATIHEAHGKRGALPAGIGPLDASMRLLGRAFTVATAIGDNLWLHRALTEAPRGSVLVVATESAMPAGDQGVDFGYWGELMTRAAIAAGIAGLVIDGHVRDREAVVESGFPVFSRGAYLRGTSKDPALHGALSGPIEIGGVSVATGDLVVGDADGVVVVARDELAPVLERAGRLAERERELMERIRAGESTLHILGLDPA